MLADLSEEILSFCLVWMIVRLYELNQELALSLSRVEFEYMW